MHNENPVTQERINIAYDFGLVNVDMIAVTCREVDVPFFVACALFQKESGGRNVYGHDEGGALSGFERPVNKSNFEVFRWLVLEKGIVSNGVGPSQITYAGPRRVDGTRDGGYFRIMEERHLKAWNVHDNMFFGLEILNNHYKSSGSWQVAGTRYNGSPAYGVDFVKKINEWKSRLGI